MIRIAEKAKESLTSEQLEDMQFMIDLLNGWQGNMDEDSIAATVYSFTLMSIHKSLFHAYEDDQDERLAFTDGFLYNEFIQTLLKSVSKDGEASRFNKVCQKAYPEYKGENICTYNIARSFSDAMRFLESNVSKRIEDWKWGNVHVVEWSNLPWSKTPLKFFWNREVHTGGNSNTPHVSKYSNRKNANRNIIRSDQAPSYKQIIQFEQD